LLIVKAINVGCPSHTFVGATAELKHMEYAYIKSDTSGKGYKKWKVR
jgi:hypothetical protein